MSFEDRNQRGSENSTEGARIAGVAVEIHYCLQNPKDPALFWVYLPEPQRFPNSGYVWDRSGEIVTTTNLSFVLW